MVSAYRSNSKTKIKQYESMNYAKVIIIKTNQANDQQNKIMIIKIKSQGNMTD